MITNTTIKKRIIPKIQRVRASGKEVYVRWCGSDHKIQVANDVHGIIINAGNTRININANFIQHEIGAGATIDMVERCFHVRSKPQTLADCE